MRTAIALLAAIITAPALAQTPPKRFADIPVFAGAKSVGTDTSDLGAEGPMQMLASVRNLEARFREVAAYEIAAHPETVYSYYTQRLGGKNIDSLEDADFTLLAPGTASGVFRLPTFHHVDAKGKALLASRPQYEGGWLRAALVLWGMRDTGGDVTSFAVGVLDTGVTSDWSSYKPRTRLVIMSTRYPNPPRGGTTLGQALGEAMTSAVKDAVKETLVAPLHEMLKEAFGAPDEATLGVAIYPGAQFDERTSNRTSRNGTRFYSYMSDDDQAQVINFYRDKTHVPPTNLGADGTVFVIDGQMPFPRSAVYVNRNTVPGRHAKSIITVRKGT